MGRNLELVIGALNGTVGDYLARTGNGLATEMVFMHAGQPLRLDPASLARAFPDASAKVAVLVHGLMNTEHVWGTDGSDYGAGLARDFGYTPLYVRYNSGLPIPDNGAALDRLLAALVEAWPVPLEELLPVGYSMGGLVVRSACHVAAAPANRGESWLALVSRAVYIGTPHLGAPLERVGRVVAKVLHAVPDPYTRLLAEIADLRSQGLQDLGDADLRHEDRERRRAGVSGVTLRDPRHPVPLLPQVRHYLAAGTLLSTPWAATLFGDSLVPVPSGTAASSALPSEHIRLFPGFSHLALAHHPDVYAQIHAWLTPATDPQTSPGGAP